LDSLVIEKNKQRDIPMTTSIFIVDTQPPSTEDISSSPYAASFSKLLDSLVVKGNQRAGRHGAVQILKVPFRSNPKTYGYDATDWALEHLLHNNVTTSTAQGSLEQPCSHFIFTNGDNYYLPFFGELPDNLKNHSFVAWDFVSHHKKRTVSVKLKPSKIDLGAFIVSADLIRSTNATFLPRGVEVDSLDQERIFTADFYFAKHLTDGLPQGRILLLHQVGMVHN
jgi:hypothetical protein